jgi:hypothetical protein
MKLSNKFNIKFPEINTGIKLSTSFPLSYNTQMFFKILSAIFTRILHKNFIFKDAFQAFRLIRHTPNFYTTVFFKLSFTIRTEFQKIISINSTISLTDNWKQEFSDWKISIMNDCFLISSSQNYNNHSLR